TALPAADREREAALRARSEAARPFDLAAGPLVRARLLRLGDQEHLLLLTLHHIVSDAWSFRVLFDELDALYGAFTEGTPSPLSPLALQYGDYAVWERRWTKSDAMVRHLDYWTGKLADAPVVEFPADRPRPQVLTGEGARIRLTWDRGLAAKTARYAKDSGATLHMLLVAALAGLLEHHNGTGDQVFGAAVAGRTRTETEKLIGFFVNTLVLRIETGDDPTLGTLVQRARSVAIEAAAHQDVPFDRVVEELRLPRELNRNPLFQIMLSTQNASHVPQAALHDLDVTVEPVDLDIAKFDLTFAFTEAADGIDVEVEFSTELFDEPTVRLLVDRFERVLRTIVTRPGDRLSQVPVLSADETRRLIELSAPEPAPLPHESVTAAFARWARETPDQPAARFGDRTLTYAELDSWANRIAHRLAGWGIGRGSRVGLCTPRCVELVVGMLAIARTGAAYIPLDPANPTDRLAFMAADAELHAVLHEESVVHVLPEGPHVTVLLDDAADEPAEPLESAVDPDDMLYIIYTSGSTGRPKGVCISHRAVMGLVWQADFVRLGPDDVLGQASNASFDVATFEVWGALCNGALVVGVPKEVLLSGPALREHIATHGVTVMNVPSSLLSVLAAETPDVFAGLRTLLFGGEAADPAAVAAVLRRPPSRMLNVYGPSETTTFSVAGLTTSVGADQATVPLGRPVSHMWVYVIGPHGGLAPLGVEGELWIGGVGLASGYWARPELTAERFVDDPFRPGERVYRSGDVGRWRTDGTLEFRGRIDDQVKIRGHRIEPGEIAAVLTQHPDVKEATVIAHRDGDQPARLIAYAVPSGLASVDEGGVRRFAVERLPEFMVPSAVVLLDRLPLNANDKVDRGALPVPVMGSGGVAERFVAPRSATEGAVAGIWCEVLGCARAGVFDDFFALGGHSLLVTQVVSRLESRLGVRVPLRAVFESPVLEHLARVVDEHLTTVTGGASREIVRVDRDSGPLPVSFAQQRLWFLDRLVPDSAFYNMPDGYEIRGPLDIGALQSAVDAVVTRHESLRTTFTERDGVPWQVIHPTASVPVHVLHADGPEQVEWITATEIQRPFDLEHGPLLRIVVIRTALDTAVLLLTMHHIVSDGWSSGVLLRELSAAYGAALDGRQAGFADLPVQYADFAVWQRDWLRGEELERQRKYWVETLKDLPALELPTDRPRPAVQSHRGAALEFTVDERTAQTLRRMAHDGRATLFMCLFSGFAAVLSRVSGQTDLALGYPVANRNHAHTEDLIGFFVNTLVLRTDLSGDPTFTELVDRVRDVALNGYAHQDLPFEDLVETLRPERDLSRNPLVQTTFQLLNTIPDVEFAGGLDMRRLDTGSTVSQFDLSMDMVDEPGRLWGWINFSTDLFDTPSIERLIGQFLRVLDTVAAQPEARISELPLIDDAERTRLLEEFTSETRPVEPVGAHQLFERQAATHPNAIALVFGQDSWSFSELN
ncbi:amino acid adenylation domain-containing protein, partial [Streptomyces sp900116325]|uniref:amino acid adenylation domain-containing protein n=1 Tax=Streptomyces sp. 900116325 TaxID=3154295 RepID=UPI0033CACF0F